MAAIHLQPCRDCAGAGSARGARRAERCRHRVLGDAARMAPAQPRARASSPQLDERMLKDIGLTRADREFLINKPFWRE